MTALRPAVDWRPAGNSAERDFIRTIRPEDLDSFGSVRVE